MTADYRTNWTMPALPLGPAIKRETVEVCPLRAFECGDYEINGESLAHEGGAETRTSGGSASETENKRNEPGRSIPGHEAVSASEPHPFKVGDRVRVVLPGGGAVIVGAIGTICDTYDQTMSIDGALGSWLYDNHWIEHV